MPGRRRHERERPRRRATRSSSCCAARSEGAASTSTRRRAPSCVGRSPGVRALPRRRHRVAPPRRVPLAIDGGWRLADVGSLNGTLRQPSAHRRRRCSPAATRCRSASTASSSSRGRGGAARRDRRRRPRGLMGIGDVLAALRPDFPDVTISKIRFLEAEGLVAPAAHRRAATASSATADVERLRYVLGLPARPVPAAQGDPRAPRGDRPRARAADRRRGPARRRAPWSRPTACPTPESFRAAAAEVRLSRAELLEASGLDDGAARAGSRASASSTKRGRALRRRRPRRSPRTVAEMAAFGIEPRHLRHVQGRRRPRGRARRAGRSRRCCASATRERPAAGRRGDPRARRAVGAAARRAGQGRARLRAAPLTRRARVASAPAG